jgi:hypothetical protein
VVHSSSIGCIRSWSVSEEPSLTLQDRILINCNELLRPFLDVFQGALGLPGHVTVFVL